MEGNEPEIPAAATMAIADIVDIPTRQAKHALATLEGEGGRRWQVCVKRGRFEVGEKVLFVKKGVLVRDDKRIKTAARSPYRRKTLFFRGGERRAYVEFKAAARPFAGNLGAILPLAPFAELLALPTGTDVSGLVGATDDAALQREMEARREERKLRNAESEARRRAAKDRAQARVSERRNRAIRDESSAGGRMCFLGAAAPNYVRVTALEHIEEHPEYFEQYREARFDVTEKEDGLNMTLYCARLQDPARPIHICIGRQEVRWSASSYYWKLAYDMGVAQRVLESGRNLVMEGVVVGPHFRHGYEDGYRRDFFRVFDVFDLDDDRTLSAEERRDFCQENGIPAVRDVLIDCPFFADYPTPEAVAALAAQKTSRGMPRHGIVVRGRGLAAGLWFDAANPRYAAFLRNGA